MRSRWSFPLVIFSLAIPAAALAAAPFATPPQLEVPLGPPAFEAPPQGPPVTAPPFDFEVPSPHASLPDLPFDLPAGALEHVLDQAPPFGGERGNASFRLVAVPEPATATLIVLGLAALGLGKRRTI